MLFQNLFMFVHFAIARYAQRIVLIINFRFNQLPTDTLKKTYANRSNSFSRIMFYKPAIFVIVN